ncbi:hypothetical protein Pme01_56560 [Planosporangium mesophilum]|uniref:Uncharacterized protein n=1 Tax=Planosporangium mesophilum TaxID=689768 RepID=A0A8J3X3Z7_9ACTN|nr:hypothetical protein Pme01_56560 [Planosporangium mesophilum]
MSGVAGSRRDAGEPTGSSVPEVDVPERPSAADPTTSSLNEMLSDPDPGPSSP